MFERIKLFLQESRRELSRVNWPTRDETTRLTGVVIALSVAIAVFLGALDFIFSKGVLEIAKFAPTSIEAPLEDSTATTTNDLPFELLPDSIEGEGNLNITPEQPNETDTPITIPTN